MKDPIIHRYEGVERFVKLADINLLANDPRDHGVEDEHVARLRELVESGYKFMGDKIPVVAPALIRESLVPYDAIGGRHRLKAYEEAKDSKKRLMYKDIAVPVFVITEPLSPAQRKLIALAENSIDVRLPLKRNEQTKNAKEMLKEHGYTRHALKQELLSLGLAERAVERMITDAIYDLSTTFARQALNVANKEGISAALAVSSLNLPPAIKPALVESAIKRVTGTHEGVVVSVQRQMNPTVLRNYNAQRMFADRFVTDLLKLHEAGRPTDEIMESFKTAHEYFLKLAGYVERHRAKYEVQLNGGAPDDFDSEQEVEEEPALA